MANKKQKIVIGSDCFYKGEALESGVGYEFAVAEVRELRGAGRVAKILADDAKLPTKPAEKTAPVK